MYSGLMIHTAPTRSATDQWNELNEEKQKKIAENFCGQNKIVHEETYPLPLGVWPMLMENGGINE